MNVSPFHYLLVDGSLTRKCYLFASQVIHSAFLSFFLSKGHSRLFLPIPNPRRSFPTCTRIEGSGEPIALIPLFALETIFEETREILMKENGLQARFETHLKQKNYPSE